MENSKTLPDTGKLSIVTALVLLAYASTVFIQVPSTSLQIQLPGFLFVVKLNFYTIIAFLAAGLAAAGTEWIIASHPRIGESRHWIHWILPAMTALVLAVPLGTITVGAAWWLLFWIGGGLFALIIVSEYVSVDLNDQLYPFAAVSLTAVALALFLILTISLRGSEARLYTLVLALLPATALLCFRELELRLAGKNYLPWLIGIPLIIAQLAFCFFYLPIKPISFGMLLFASTFALTNLAVNYEESKEKLRLWLDPAISFVVFAILGLLL